MSWRDEFIHNISLEDLDNGGDRYAISMDLPRRIINDEFTYEEIARLAEFNSSAFIISSYYIYLFEGDIWTEDNYRGILKLAYKSAEQNDVFRILIESNFLKNENQGKIIEEVVIEQLAKGEISVEAFIYIKNNLPEVNLENIFNAVQTFECKYSHQRAKVAIILVLLGL